MLKFREMLRDGNCRIGHGIVKFMLKTDMHLICLFLPDQVQPAIQLMLYTQV